MSRQLLGEITLLAGALLILVAAIGVLRFSDALARMHALSKASTAGVALALIGAAVTRANINDVMSLLFATALQAATNPVASTLLTQATYYAGGVTTRVDTIDELATTTTQPDGDADGGDLQPASHPT